MGVLDPFGQPLGLDAQNQLAPLCAVGVCLRHKRGGGDKARQLCLAKRQVKADARVAGRRGGKGRAAGTLLLHALQVKFGGRPAVAEGRRFSQQRAVFGNQVVGGKGHIGCALAVTGVGVQIGTEQPPALPGHKGAAVIGLADRLVAGRKVRNHRRAGQRVGAAWRYRGPEVFAQLHPKYKTWHLAAAEQKRGAERRFLPGQRDAAHPLRSGGEVAQLIKLGVVGQVGLGHKAEQLAVAEYGCTVVQLGIHPHRQADERDKVKPGAGLQNLGQRVLGRAQQRLLQKQVAAGVAG